MSDLVPSGNDPNAGLNFDVGVSVHEWSTRWAEIGEMAADDLEGAVEAATELLGVMMTQLAIPTEGAAAPETEDMVRDHEALRDLVDRMGKDVPVDQDELADGLDTARDVFDYLVAGRREDDEMPLP
jgi:hypothetical protein